MNNEIGNSFLLSQGWVEGSDRREYFELIVTQIEQGEAAESLTKAEVVALAGMTVLTNHSWSGYGAEMIYRRVSEEQTLGYMKREIRQYAADIASWLVAWRRSDGDLAKTHWLPTLFGLTSFIHLEQARQFLVENTARFVYIEPVGIEVEVIVPFEKVEEAIRVRIPLLSLKECVRGVPTYEFI